MPLQRSITMELQEPLTLTFPLQLWFQGSEVSEALEAGGEVSVPSVPGTNAKIKFQSHEVQKPTHCP